MQINQISQLLNSSGLNSITGTDSTSQSTDASVSFEKALEDMLINMATQTADSTSNTANTSGTINAATAAQSTAANGLSSLQTQSQNIAQILQALSSQNLMQGSTLGSDTSSSDPSNSDSTVNALGSSATI